MQFTSAALAALALAAALGAAPAAAQSLAPSLFGSNLIVNGDAEADQGKPGGAAIGAVTGFDITSTFTVVSYAIGGGFPVAGSPGPADRGSNFFAGGPGSGASSASQVIGLANGAAEIDAGTVQFDLSAYLGGFSSQHDNARLSLSFLDADGGVLGNASVGPVSNAERGNATGLLLREASGLVPVGTRSARLLLQMTRVNGAYNDGYADNLSLTLTAAPVPEPAAVLLMLAGLGVVGVAGRTRSGRAR